MNKIQTYINNFMRTQGYKAFALAGVLALVALALLESILFTLILGLMKLALGLGGIALLVYAAYLAYPTVLQKVKEMKK